MVRRGRGRGRSPKDGEQGQIARIVGRDGPKEGRQGMASKAVSKDGWQRRLASAMKRCVLIQKADVVVGFAKVVFLATGVKMRPARTGTEYATQK